MTEDIKIEEPNVILFKALKFQEENEANKTSTNEFIELFLEDGPFEHLFVKLVGCSMFNFFQSTFSVTFKRETKESFLDNFLEEYCTPKEVVSANGCKYLIQVNRPQKKIQMVTLYPTSHNITENQIKEITKNWGKFLNYRFGRHKRCPLLLNNYLHVFITNFKRNQVPDTIRINQKTITIQVQGEENQPRCSYCKEKSHIIENCPSKPPLRERKLQTLRTNTYAAKLKSSNPSLPIIQHNPPKLTQRLSTPTNLLPSPSQMTTLTPKQNQTPPTTSRKQMSLFSPLSSTTSTPSSTNSINFNTANESTILLSLQEQPLPLTHEDFPALPPQNFTTSMTPPKQTNKRNRSNSNPENEYKKPNQKKSPESNLSQNSK